MSDNRLNVKIISNGDDQSRHTHWESFAGHLVIYLIVMVMVGYFLVKAYSANGFFVMILLASAIALFEIWADGRPDKKRSS